MKQLLIVKRSRSVAPQIALYVILIKILFFPKYMTFLKRSLIALSLLNLIVLPGSVNAQIIPDQTLGNENSKIIPDGVKNLIQGGAIRGENLFHSFSEFNINNNQQVYFTNPSGINNILTRITGSNISNINGLLGVEGNANFFLINPNGIIFGNQAQLDIKGSFFATTATGIKLGENGLFSATEPEKSNLLTIKPNAYFNNALQNQQAEIKNQGNLTVGNGQTLSLYGANINNTGNLTAPGGKIEILGNNINITAPGQIDVSDTQKSGKIFIGKNESNLINAQNTYIGENVNIKADTSSNTESSKIIISADQTTKFYGNISAQSGENAPGNLIEISGKEKLVYRGNLNPENKGTLALNTDNMIIDIQSPPTIEIIGYPDGSYEIIEINNDDENATIYTQKLAEISGNTNIIFSANNNITIGDLSLQPLTFKPGQGIIKLIADADHNGQGNITMLAPQFTYSAVNGIDVDSDQLDSFTIFAPIINTQGRNIDIQGVNLDLKIIDTTNPNTQLKSGIINLSANNDIRFIQLTGNNINLKNEGNINFFLLDAKSDQEDISINFNSGGNIINSSGYIFLNSMASWTKKLNFTAKGDIIGRTIYGYSSNQNSNGAEINLTSDGNIQLFKINNSAIFSQNQNATNGGNINLKSGGNITISKLKTNSLIKLFGNGKAGNGGTITIESVGNVAINQIDTSSFSPNGNSSISGGININTNKGNISIKDINAYGELGRGNINIQGEQISLDNINASGGGNGGNINIKSQNNLILNDMSINSDTTFNGNGGDIIITAPNITLNTTDLTTIAGNQGNAGNIKINADNSILLDKWSRLFTSLDPGAMGTGGNITLNGKIITLNQGSFIDTATFGTGNAGNVEINASKSVLLDSNSGIFSITSGIGNAGNVKIKAGENIILSQQSNISTAVNSTGNGSGGNVTIETPNLTLNYGAQIQGLTKGKGDAGKINLTINDQVKISGIGNDGYVSGVFTSSGVNSQGKGGDIVINTGKLILTEGGVLNAQTSSNFDGGNIQVNAQNVEITQGGQILTNTFGNGNAGNLLVNATEKLLIDGFDANFNNRIIPPPAIRENVPILPPKQITEIEDNDTLKTAQFLTDNLFSLTPTNNINPDVIFSTRIPYISIQGEGSKPDELIFFSFPCGGICRGMKYQGTDLDIYSFKVTPGTRAIFDIDHTTGQFTTLSLFDSQGKLLIENKKANDNLGAGGSNNGNYNPYMRYVFTTPGIYYIQVSEVNQFVPYTLQVSLETPNVRGITINNGANSGLFAQTQGLGKAGTININTPNFILQNNALVSATTSGGIGGSININANELNLNSGGKLLTTTFGNNPAGDINIKVRDQITLSDKNTGFFANTNINSKGKGGSINIDPITMIIKDNAGIAVNSQGAGIGGNIFLEAGNLILSNQGFINAETASNQGGEITLNIANYLLFANNNNKITSTAGTSQSGGNGGNIQINAPLIIALPTNINNQIIANAFTGKGGNIEITTDGIFGGKYLDITASSQFGVQGTIEINTPGIDPNSGLTQLPSIPIDISALIKNSCQVSKKSSFKMTGRGGLPSTPFQVLDGNSVAIDLANNSNQIREISSLPKVDKENTPTENKSNFQEAQGWIKDDQGRIILTLKPLEVTPQSLWLNSVNCHN